jgi:hypothetical protein
MTDSSARRLFNNDLGAVAKLVSVLRSPVLLLLLLPFLANGPALLRVWDTNPAMFFSAMRVGGRRSLPGYPTSDPNIGFTSQAVGRFSADEWLHGAIPWWDHYAGVGLPLTSEVFMGNLFLPFVLLMHFFQGVLYLQIVMQMVAGLATYALLRQIGLGRFASVSGAALFELNGSMAVLGGVVANTLAFLPLLLFGIERAWRLAKERRRGGWIWIPISLAYSLYAGFPEVAYLDGLLGLAWAIYRFSEDSAARWGFARKVIGGGITGILLSAPVLWPFVALFKESLMGGHGGSGFSKIGQLPAGLPIVLFPYIYGPIYAFSDFDPSNQLDTVVSRAGGYLSVTMLFLMVLSLVKTSRKQGLRWLLSGWIMACWAKTWNVPGISVLINLIPMVKQAAFFRYAPPCWEIAACILVALALDDWRQGDALAGFGLLAAQCATVLISAAALLAGLPIMQSLWHAVRLYHVFFWAHLSWTALTMTGVAVLYALGPGRDRAALLGGWLIFDGMLMYSVPSLSGLLGRPELDLRSVSYLHERLGDSYRF